MTGAHLIFLLTVLPVLFFAVVWVIGIVIRLTVPEKTLPPDVSLLLRRRELTMSGRTVPVGVREIREDYRLITHRVSAQAYRYEGYERHRIPEEWVEDLERRRN